MTEARAPSSETLAPWAEIVPDMMARTVDDLLTLQEDQWQYELVEGGLVRMPPSGYRASRTAARLLILLGTFVEAHQLGAVTGADGAYTLSAPGAPPTQGTGLAPDVAFVRASRLPPYVALDEDKAFPFAPDLAVEVAAPSQYRPGMAKKAARYLEAGTRLVWIVWPTRREVDVWLPGDMRPTRTLTVEETLEGDAVLPGFSISVAALFT